MDTPYGFGFGTALEFLRGGDRVARAGWNGRGMYLFLYTPRGDFSLDGTTAPVLPFIVMATVGDERVPWLASQTDVLAMDWVKA